MKSADEASLGVLPDAGSYVRRWPVAVIFENNNPKDHKETIGPPFACMSATWGGSPPKMQYGGCSDIDKSGGCGSRNSSG